jgi:hypothetical protein
MGERWGEDEREDIHRNRFGRKTDENERDRHCRGGRRGREIRSALDGAVGSVGDAAEEQRRVGEGNLGTENESASGTLLRFRRRAC